MPIVPADEDREHRITDEVIVDCYDEYEVAMGWYCYLADRLDFPFQAKWLAAGASKPKTVQVVGMASEDECKTDILVEIERLDEGLTDVLLVPLLELEPVEEKAERSQAIEDWRYWLDQGNQLVDPDEFEAY